MPRSVGTSMRLTTPLLPGSTRLARIVAVVPSPAAVQRLEVVRWYEAHGRLVRLTARHSGYGPDTVSRWLRALRERGPAGLEDRSRRPKRVRQPTTPSAVVIRIRELRERYPRWGREKLRVLLAREGVRVSAKTIDRTVARLRRRGCRAAGSPGGRRPGRRAAAAARALWRGPARPSAARAARAARQELRRGGPFTFAAVDHLTRKRVVGAAARITSEEGARFFEIARSGFPFPIWAIQTDGGCEFMGDFAAAVAAAGIPHDVNRPNYPKGQGRIERTFNTLVYAGVSTVFVCVGSALVGFVIAKHRSRFGDIVLWTMLGSVMIPAITYVQATHGALATVERATGFPLVNTLWGMLLPTSVSAFGVFLMRQAMYTVSDELLGAAELDGASTARVFWYIVLPLVRPQLSALAVLHSLGAYNDVLWPMVMATKSEMYTLSVGLVRQAVDYEPQWGLVSAGAVVAVVPILLIYMRLRRSIVSSLGLQTFGR